MRILFLFIVLTFNTSLFCQKIAFTFTIAQSIPYCGGAAPTQEMIDETQKIKPYANKTFFIYQKGKCVDSVTSNESGVFTVKLAKGHYNLYERWKKAKTGPWGDDITEYDKLCLEKEWKKVDITISLNKAKKSIVSNMTSSALCFWQYPCRTNKAMPPTTRPQ
jgi:hypothetical protein